MNARCRLIALLALGALAPASAASGPHIGFVYPAGGRAGTTFRVMAGGQNLPGIKGAVLSGGGMEAKFISQSPLVPKLDKEQTIEARRRIQARRDVLSATNARDDSLRRRLRPDEPPAGVQLPDHPFLNTIGEMDAGDLKDLDAALFKAGKKLQRSPELARLAILEISLAPNAQPGRREIRLLTRAGLTNPLAFEVGHLPESCVPRVPGGGEATRSGNPLELPVVVNGQILPGQTRSIAFRGRKGQRFVAKLQARRLIPFISDAVPGWFQAVMALRDEKGREIAFGDDFLFEPDPVLQTTLPADGVYTLDIRDALYRGRQDFVFRVALGDLPVLYTWFPLGAREGTASTATLLGTGLPISRVKLDTAAGGGRFRSLTVPATGGLQVCYAVNRWPEVQAPADGAPIEVRAPVTLNGRLDRVARQVIRFRARAGENVAIEVLARRLGSPLDASIEIKAPDGKTLATADDEAEKDGDLFVRPALLTHQADPELDFHAATNGTYSLIIRDVGGRPGPLEAYRINIAPSEPRFELSAAPSALNLGRSKRAPVIVRIVRKGGLTAPVKLAVAPARFRIQPAEIPAGANTLKAEIVCDEAPPSTPVALTITGSAEVAGQTVEAKAAPTDEIMQAFLWRHLVPARDFLAVATAPPKPRK